MSNLVSAMCDQYSTLPISGCVVLIGWVRFSTFVLNVFSHSDRVASTLMENVPM